MGKKLNYYKHNVYLVSSGEKKAVQRMGANYTVSEFCIIKGFYGNLTLKRHLN